MRGDGGAHRRGARRHPRRHLHRGGDRRAGEGHRPRHRRLRRRPVGVRRAGRPLDPLRAHVLRRPGHRAGAADHAGRRAGPARRPPPRSGAGRPGARARRHAVRRAHPRHPRRADHVRDQAGRLRLRGRAQRCSGSSGRSARPPSGRCRARSVPTRPPHRISRRACWRGWASSAEPVSTQVVARDRHAELLQAIALAGAGLERFATELRHLARTEVGEVREPFGRGQKGSSSMPHKRNPIKSEQVAGLARVLRGNANAAVEDVALWHERDISHSSVERIILPDSTILLDHMQRRVLALVEGMVVDAARMRREPGAHLRRPVLPACPAGPGGGRQHPRRRLPGGAARGPAGAGRARAACASCWRATPRLRGSISMRSSTTPRSCLMRARSSTASTRSPEAPPHEIACRAPPPSGACRAIRVLATPLPSAPGRRGLCPA